MVTNGPSADKAADAGRGTLNRMASKRWLPPLLLLISLPVRTSGATHAPDAASLGERPYATYYAPCGDAMGVDCRAGLECVTFGDHRAGICLPLCASTADCPTGRGPSVCGIELADDSFACGVDCSIASCPFGTTCQDADEGRRICEGW